MAELLRMPEIATGTDEATLVSWPIEVAAEFTESDVIAVVETAKAVVDVEAGRAGVLVRTLVEPGTDVKVGAPIALIAGVVETLGEVDEVLRSLSSDAPAEPAPVPALAAPALAAPPADLARIFASPLARRMAREGGLALADLTGPGLGGLVERAGSGQLRQAELEGGSTTVTNLGRFGTEEFTAIINPPHSSILSVGAI